MTVAPLLRRWGLVSAVLLLCAAVLAQNSANADTPPALASATANSGTLTLTFDENLDTASEPATGAFTVKAAPRDVAERTIAVSDVSIAGSAVTLTLASAVAAIDSVTVSYADPGASNDPLQDADGNRVASFTDRDAANLTERARVTAVGRLAQQWEVNINETNLVTHHPFRVIFIFDRAVTGVDEDDYSVLNGELESQNCVSNGRSCWVTVQATGDDGDPIRVTMRTHAVDQGNDEASYESVITAPELTVDISTTATEPVTRTFRASVTFSSEVPQDVDFNYEVRVFPVPSHFSKSDLRIANGSSAGRWTVTERSDDDRAKKFSLLVRPRSNFEGTLTVRLPAGRVVAVVGTRNPEASLDVEVDTLGPRVTGISAVSSTGGDGRYTAGDTVAVEVTFHEDVHLDDSDLPELFLEVGRSTRSAVYDAALSAAAGANKLVFAYRFADVDRDGDGLSVAANSLIGTIKDAHGNEAPLTHAAQGPWSDHRVGAAPVSSDATVTTDEDTDYTFAAGDFSFSDADPGDALASVKITALPANGKGTLALDGTAITWSDVPKAVTKGELDDGKLTYSPPADANGDDYAAFLFKVNDGAEDSASHNEITIDVTPVNDAATGEPAISGVARVGQTLTASTAGIADADGLSGVSYSYQWLRVDADGTSNLAEIANATAATYTLAPDDQGKRVIVTVSFTDEDGTDEALNSDAYPSPGTVTEERTFTLTVAAIATDDKVNIAEQAAGFKISGTTGSEAGVSVTVTIGSASLPATSADDAGTATWSVTVPPNAAYLTEGSVDVTVSAEKVGYTPPDNVERTLAVDLTAPTAPTYAAPAALKVGAAIAAINPAGGSGIDSYAAAGLPPGLIIAADTGAITGTPTTANDSIAAVTVTVSDAAGNADTVDIDFPAVAKGDQTLSGFEYSASTVTFGDAAPTVTAPTGAETELSYTTNDAAVCTVDASTGALTLNGAGSCVVTATAAGTDDWNAATATYTVTVQAAGALSLTVAAIATDDKVNIAEQAAGFKISGTTGSEAGVSVTVTIGSASLPATSADDAGTATWSVTVPPNAAYLTEGSVDVTVSAEKVGYTPPDNVERTLAVDLTAPTAPTYAAPAALKVGAAIAAINPAGGSGIDSYAAAGLPPGLIIAADTGAITGTPTTANDSIAAVTVTVSDAAGNADTVDIDFPAVAKGDQTLSGFEYSASTVTFGDAAPTVTAPTGAETELSYTTNDAAVCTVDASTGALTLNGAGSCVVTATAAGTDDWNAATAAFTVPVAAAGTPGVPTALLAVAGNGIARLAWTAPAKAGASPVTGYQYQLRADGEGYGAWTDTGHGLGVHQAVTGLSDDTLYTFRVRAVNAAGTGHASAEATATTNTEFRPVIIGDSTAAQATTFRITITFDRDVPELRHKALVVGGGVLIEKGERASPRMSQPGGREWAVHVQPNFGFTGWLTVDIPAGAVRDTDGNLNVAAVQYRRLIKAQHVRPRLYMKLAPDPETGVVRDPSEPVSGPFAVDLRFTSGSIFHQPVTGLTLDDIVITNGTKANLVQVRAGSFEGDYEVTVTPDPTYTGPFTITVEEGAAYACNDLDDLSTCDESNLSLGDTLALNVAAPNSMRQLNPDLQGKPQKPNGKRFARGRSVTGGTVEGCAVEVTVRFRDADGDAVAVESLAASDFTAENGRVGTPSASPDGLAWTVPAWASRGFTGPMRVRLIATGRWQAAEQVFHVASDTDCAPAARNELASLSLDGLDLDPAFDAGTTAYAAAAPADGETVTVTAAAVYGASEVTVLPADADTGAEGHQVALAEGETGVTVTVTPADGSGAQTYTVTVTRGSAAANAGVLTGFVLVDASTDADLGAVENGGTVTVSADGRYGIRAGVETNAEVGSVVLSLVGPGAEDTHTQTENIAPYSLYGDAQGAEHGRALPAGSYTLSATAYAERGGAGEALGTLTVPFAVAVETQAPPALTVADAQAEEGTDATLDFAVTLDKESTGTVTVAYATSDGTATAGSDYTAVSGTLTFAAGETEKTVSVPVLEDDHNEGSETLTLRLSSPSGATIDDGEATGTITNSDAIPEAWLARFGRTVTGQVLDAVEQRLTGPRQAGVRASLAGQALPSWTPGSGLRSGAGGGTAAARSGSGSGTNPGAGSGTRPPGSGSGAGSRDPEAGAGPGAGDNAGPERLSVADSRSRDAMETIRNWMADAGAGSRGAGGLRSGVLGGDNRSGFRSRALTPRDFLTGSSFALTVLTGGAKKGGYAALWGRGAIAGFDGREGALSLDGEVTTGLIGADWASDPGSGSGAGSGRWVAGLAIGHSTGTGGWRRGGECDPNCGGGIEATLTGLYPYAGIDLTDRLSVWAAAGYGAGEVTVTPEGGSGLTADLTMAMGAAGLRSNVLRPEDGNGLSLDFKGDARFTRTASDAVRSGGGNLEAAEADVWLIRAGVEGSRRFALGNGTDGGASLTPSFEAGLRLDGGAAERGFGADLGGGLAFADPESGLRLDLKGRVLIAHSSAGFKEWGASGALAWDPRPTTDRGLSLSLRQSWGAAPAGGMDALLSRETLAGLAANDNPGSGSGAGGSFEASSRLEAEIGYGLAMFGGAFTGTPNIGFGLSGGGGRDWRLGWRLTSAVPGDPGFEVSLDATRREPANDDEPPELEVTLKAAIRW